MEDYLAHYGVTGMKWGVRRYQNYDGSYTKKGLERYKKSEAKYDEAKSRYKSYKVKANDALKRYADREDEIEKPYKRGQYLSDEDYRKELENSREYDNEMSKLKSERAVAKRDMKAAKKEMNKNYKQLKIDRRADEGKKLYQRGKTITSIDTANFLKVLGITAVATIAANAAYDKGMTWIVGKNNIPVSSIIAGVGTAGGLGAAIKGEIDKSKLRAYYAH